MKNNFYYVLKNIENDLYFLDNDITSIKYVDNAEFALHFFTIEDLKQFINYLALNYSDIRFVPRKIELREYSFICR